MNRLLIGLALIASVTLSGFAQDNDDDERTPRTVSVRGSGSVSVEPDQVRLSMQVSVRGESASAAMTQASEQTSEVIKLLRSLHVGDKDITTTRISVTPVYDREKRVTPPPIIGYAASNDLTILFKKETMKKLGEFLDRSVSLGASNFGSLMYESSEMRGLERTALGMAAADARSRAEGLASVLGASVGTVLTIKETGMQSPGPVPMDFVRGEMAMAAPVMAGEMEVKASVDVVFELKSE